MTAELRDKTCASTAELLEHEPEYDGRRLLRGFRNAVWLVALIWIVLCVGALLLWM